MLEGLRGNLLLEAGRFRGRSLLNLILMGDRPEAVTLMGDRPEAVTRMALEEIPENLAEWVASGTRA